MSNNNWFYDWYVLIYWSENKKYEHSGATLFTDKFLEPHRPKTKENLAIKIDQLQNNPKPQYWFRYPSKNWHSQRLNFILWGHQLEHKFYICVNIISNEKPVKPQKQEVEHGNSTGCTGLHQYGQTVFDNSKNGQLDKSEWFAQSFEQLLPDKRQGEVLRFVHKGSGWGDWEDRVKVQERVRRIIDKNRLWMYQGPIQSIISN